MKGQGREKGTFLAEGPVFLNLLESNPNTRLQTAQKMGTFSGLLIRAALTCRKKRA